VITVGNSFVATAFAISYTGATPVFVDVDPRDYTIDVNLVSEAITTRTKAILPVHLYGQPAEIAALKQLAEHHGLRIVEDACQAHGARWQERRVGTWGDAGCFSFYPGKNLGAFGDGGAIVTDDADVAERLRMFRNYGQRKKNVHTMLAYNSRLDTLQAAVLLVKLKHLDRWTAQRRAAADAYRDLLAESPVELPYEKSHVQHVYHLFVVQHEQRDELLHFLGTRDVRCGIHYPVPLHHAAPYKTARTVPHGLPVCSHLAARILSLPLFPEITHEQIQHVAAAIRDFSLTAARA
jgi:dTDP-4-amino-4,6-dideoxygalactose transaminase